MRFTQYLKLLIEIASYQTQYVTVDRVIQVTNRRVNALEFVIIPEIENTIKWIEGELDELDREDFYRLKCVQDKKKEAKEQEEKEQAAKRAKDNVDGEDQIVSKVDDDIFQQFDQGVGLEEEEDNDILF
jgi:V-type H+-transporting ATPase subunit D